MSSSNSGSSNSAPGGRGGYDAISIASCTRILQRRGRRLAVRLEIPFWEQLKSFAKEDGVALADFVHRLVGSQVGDVNKTSVLRVYCINRLQSNVATAATHSENSGPVDFIITCPVPAIILTAERKLIAYNAPFLREFLSSTSSATGGSTPPLPRLTFDQPFNRIIRHLLDNPKKFVVSQIGFVNGQVSRQCRVRYCLINRSQGGQSSVLAFVEPMTVSY